MDRHTESFSRESHCESDHKGPQLSRGTAKWLNRGPDGHWVSHAKEKNVGVFRGKHKKPSILRWNEHEGYTVKLYTQLHQRWQKNGFIKREQELA